MTRRWPRIVVATFCLLAAAASASEGAKLTGAVFVTMESGDVKRGADVQVSVVSASSEFIGQWDAVQTHYQQEVAHILVYGPW